MSDDRPSLHILVLVPGHRPATLLERTLIDLRASGVVPHEIHVIAYPRRLDELRRGLMTNGRFGEYCSAHGFSRDDMLFNARTLHGVSGDVTNGDQPVTDWLVNVLRNVSSSRDATLIVVAADDAGAVAHLVHASLQLVAGVNDRFLVAPAARTRHADRGRPHLDVPLLLWPPEEVRPASYAEAVARRRLALQRLRRPDMLRLDAGQRLVRVGETSLVLPAIQFFWLWYLAASAGERFPLADITSALAGPRRTGIQVTQHLTGGGTRTFPQDLQRVFALMFPLAADKFEPMFLRACGPHPGLPSTVSKINSALRRALGSGAAPYLIQGGRGAGGYRIALPASAIHMKSRA